MRLAQLCRQPWFLRLAAGLALLTTALKVSFSLLSAVVSEAGKTDSSGSPGPLCKLLPRT